MALNHPPPADDGEALARWHPLWREHPPATLITNARVECQGLTMRPLAGNATYVTSLWDHYGRYAYDEFRLLPAGLRHLAATLFTLVRSGFPARLLRETWLIENQPVSTPLWTRPDRALIPPPGHARRGLRRPPPPGCLGLPSRIIWTRSPGQRRKVDNRRDERLEAAAEGDWRPLADADFDRATALYTQLYLDKYSALNPRYTAPMLRAMAAHGLVEFHGLFLGGELAGVIGLYGVADWVTTPILGYDRSRPRATALYRRLAHRVLQLAESRGLHQHLSAGAGAFKRLRGAEAAMEWIWVNPTRPSVRLSALRLIAGVVLREARRRGL